MEFDLLRPCRECPYTGSVPGWIGAHEDPQEFIDIARAETPFPCHMTVDHAIPLEEALELPGVQACAGCAAFRASLCKLPRDRELAAHQKRVVAAGLADVLTPAELLEVHRQGGRA